jgi:hypothetical protein
MSKEFNDEFVSPLVTGKRPFEPEWFGEQPEHYFRKLRPGIEAFPWGTLDPNDFEPKLLKRAQLSWTEAAFNEYCTAVAFTQLVQALLEVNAPIDLIGMASDFLADEMLHVEMTARLANELGGGANYQVDFTQLQLKLDEHLSPMQRANELVVRVCCVGEAFSLPMLAGCMKSSTHPLIQKVFEQIVKDEALHGRLGFLYLEWADEFLDDEERARLGRCAGDTLLQLSLLWRNLKSRVVGDKTSEGYKVEDIRKLGWMISEDYRRVAEESVRKEVVGPLAEFDIEIPTSMLEQILSKGA